MTTLHHCTIKINVHLRSKFQFSTTQVRVSICLGILVMKRKERAFCNSRLRTHYNNVDIYITRSFCRTINQLLRNVKTATLSIKFFCLRCHFIPADNMVEVKRLELLGEKTLHQTVNPKLLVYCPSMDLIALGSTDQQVLIYRLNGQRVYGAAQKVNTLRVEKINWKPNGIERPRSLIMSY